MNTVTQISAVVHHNSATLLSVTSDLYRVTQNGCHLTSTKRCKVITVSFVALCSLFLPSYNVWMVVTSKNVESGVVQFGPVGSGAFLAAGVWGGGHIE